MNSIWRYAFERAIKEGHSRDAAARFAERAVNKWASEVLGECREARS